MGACSALILVSGAGPSSRRGTKQQQHAFVILQPLRRHRNNACVFVGCLLDVLMSGQSMCRIGETLSHNSLQTQDASPCACTGPLRVAVGVLYITQTCDSFIMHTAFQGHPFPLPPLPLSTPPRRHALACPPSSLPIHPQLLPHLHLCLNPQVRLLTHGPQLMAVRCGHLYFHRTGSFGSSFPT